MGGTVGREAFGALPVLLIRCGKAESQCRHKKQAAGVSVVKERTPWGRQKGRAIPLTNHCKVFFIKQRSIIVLIGWAIKGINLFCVLLAFPLL